MIRPNNYLLKEWRLFQQFLVDCYCKIETEWLQFFRREQKRLCILEIPSSKMMAIQGM